MKGSAMIARAAALHAQRVVRLAWTAFWCAIAIAAVLRLAAALL
jgi:hypothetical protein